MHGGRRLTSGSRQQPETCRVALVGVCGLHTASCGLRGACGLLNVCGLRKTTSAGCRLRCWLSQLAAIKKKQ